MYICFVTGSIRTRLCHPETKCPRHVNRTTTAPNIATIKQKTNQPLPKGSFPGLAPRKIRSKVPPTPVKAAPAAYPVRSAAILQSLNGGLGGFKLQVTELVVAFS